MDECLIGSTEHSPILPDWGENSPIIYKESLCDSVCEGETFVWHFDSAKVSAS